MPAIDQRVSPGVTTTFTYFDSCFTSVASEAVETVLKPAPINTNSDAPRIVLASFALLLVLIYFLHLSVRTLFEGIRTSVLKSIKH